MAELRVLVVEDEEVVARNLRAFLEDEGFVVGVAESAEEGLEILKNDGGYAVGIVDMRLPGMDGQAFLVRARRLRPEMRFLIHTGSPEYLSHDGKVSQELCLALGVSPEHVFVKPVRDMHALVNAIVTLAQQGVESHA